MSNTDKLREIARKHFPIDKDVKNNTIYNQIQQSKQDSLLSDLTALISEKQAEYFEFVKRIGFYSTTLYYRDIDEKWLRTRFDIDGIPTEEYDEYTTEELFEYWKTNEK